jgi:D-glucuronyl C5-epimerase C-terminus
MRRLNIAILVLLAGLFWGATGAHGASVLQVSQGRAQAVSEPALDGSSRVAGPRPTARARRPVTAAAVRIAARADAVRRTVQRAFASGSIDAAARDGYLKSWADARRTYRSLRGQRRSELGYVIATLERLAAKGRLTPRLAPLFLILDRNREWWAKAGPPASGARLRFGGSRVLFQYFPGMGLQLHPLGNFGQANGYWYARDHADLRSLLEDLEEIAVNRGGFLTWEYYFAYGGGSPPWISGMAQGTAMQAYARASQRLADPAFLEVARRARGAFDRRTPVGVLAPQGSQDWYALYSFAPSLNVLNGMLQAVNGVRTYAEIAGDAVAQKAFERGDRTARAVIRQFDTGAWSLYHRPGGRPGHEANLNYHTLNRDFARNLCRATKAEPYCTASDNFTQYMKDDPTLDPHRAVPSPAVAGKGVKFRYRLSKIGRVAITVKDAASGRTYFSTSAFLGYGSRWFRWVPPMRTGEHTYTYTISARDLAGNSGSVEGEVRVKGTS